MKTPLMLCAALLLVGCGETQDQKFARMRAEGLQQRSQQYAGSKPTMLAAWEEQAKADPRSVQKELTGPFGHIKDAEVAALRIKVDALVMERDKADAEAKKVADAKAAKEAQKQAAAAAETRKLINDKKLAERRRGVLLCEIEKGTNAAHCHGLVTENGHLRQAPYFTGGHKQVKRTGLVIVVDCLAKTMPMQDDTTGKNYGAATGLDGTAMSRALTSSVCSDAVAGTDKRIRMF